MVHRRTVIKETKITDNLKHTIFISNDEELIFLKVNYMGERFVVEKRFQNNYLGLEDFKRKVGQFDTEDKLKKYLKLEDSNE